MRDDFVGEAAQVLLMQLMFFAYLEDCKIIKENVFRNTPSCAPASQRS